MNDHPSLPWSIFDNLPEPVLVLDDHRTVISANRAAKDLLGPAVETGDLVLALRQPNALAVAEAALAGDKPDPSEVTITDGVPRIFEVRAAPIPGEGENRAVLTLHDTTRERRAEGMRVDFVANVSHELRSPLAALLGFVETLRGPARDDEEARDRFLGIMQGEAERMTRLIDDLLSLSRVEADEHIRPRDRIDVGQLLGRVVDIVRGRADRHDVRIEIDSSEGLPDVMGDSDQLSQVFQNLTDNAVKYGRAGTMVRLEVASAPPLPGGVPAVVIRVIDQGEGIPANDLPRLTERFYRVDKARSRSLGGTGLGLAIVKHIVGRHRGRLDIDSEEGRGSTFSVTLPAFTKPLS